MREPVCRGGHDTDRLMSISDIRMLFKLGRTAGYELTRPPGFPAPVRVSRRCLRWWASEVDAYADTLQREGAQRTSRGTTTRQADRPATEPGRSQERYEPPAAAWSRHDHASGARPGH